MFFVKSYVLRIKSLIDDFLVPVSNQGAHLIPELSVWSIMVKSWPGSPVSGG